MSYILNSPEMREVIRSLVVANKKRPDNLVTILKEITAISEDKRLPLLLISLRFLQDTQPLQNAQVLISFYTWIISIL